MAITAEVLERSSDERWAPVMEQPYILSREDAKHLRAAMTGKQMTDRLANFRHLEPLFQPQVWEQVLAHIEGMEG